MTVVACHDGSAMADFYCAACNSFSHIHETQLDGAPDDADVGGRCFNCGTIIVLDRAAIDEQLARSRERLAAA